MQGVYWVVLRQDLEDKAERVVPTGVYSAKDIAQDVATESNNLAAERETGFYFYVEEVLMDQPMAGVTPVEWER